MVWWNNKQIDQWDRMESPEIDPHKSSQLLLDKGAKAIQWSKVVFSTNGAGTTGHLHVKKKKLI